MCTNDDKANCCGRCGEKRKKIVAVMAVHGRLPLLKHTINRLYKKNRVHAVICVGETQQEKLLVEQCGAVWVQHVNKPLGKKWNAGFLEAKKLNPDACLFIGSSDWISDNYLDVMVKHIDKYDLVGVAGCHFMHVDESPKACYWPGYTNHRKDESIGIGRIISAKILDAINWQPFEDHLLNSLDNSMQKKVIRATGSIHMADSSEVKLVSISTNRWVNMHKFSDHFNNILPSKKVENIDDFIDENFPEAKLIF